ncbi:MAG: RluA family pseudouridine synthase [Candidatus Peribacteraceae bacterium]|nr:RluA family pseudouridine synthase [Candidatus Peribacteraceae bacterium]
MPSWTVSFPVRLDIFLASEERMLSRSKAQRAIEEGRVSVNDAVVSKVALRLQEGDTVALRDEEAAAAETAVEPADLHLTVLYEDGACLVLDKPAGIAVHTGAGMAPGEKTILHGAAFLFRERSIPFSSESVLVHRLDKDTTGCLLLAKDPASHMALQKQFETRTVEKQYLALIAGVPEHPAAMIDAPIGRSTSDRTTMAVRGAGGSREAQTSYRVLAAKDRAALVLCNLHTGRTHQVRVHLHSIGHPVLGDGTYGNELAERLGQEFGIRSLCLHAWKLRFRSPADGKDHAIIAPLPSSFSEVLERAQITFVDR